MVEMVETSGAPPLGATPAAAFADLARARAILSTTFRRDGTPVATPVWLVHRGGKIYATSAAGAGKVKRLRANPRVRLAPCTQRGRPTEPATEGRARLPEVDEAPWLPAAFYRRYPVLARFLQTLNRLQGQRQLAIEITPLAV